VQERQLPPEVVAVILAAGDVALLLLEIPTGWFADRFGHRASLILGSIIQVAGMVCAWLGAGIPELVVACLLVAVGDGFRSGADEALLFRSCAALGREDRFLNIQSRAHTLEVCALVALVAGGGAIATMWGLHAAWAAETALCAVGVVFAWAMVEPPAAPSRDEAEGQNGGEPLAWTRLVPVILPVALLGGAASAGSFLAQTTGGGGAAELTMLVALITAAEAAGAALAPRMPAAGARGQLILAICGALVVGAALLAPVLFYPAVVGLAFLEGVAEPLRAAAIQQEVRDTMRARAASAANACDMLFSLIALPLAGMWAKR
jgi:MFS family permease